MGDDQKYRENNMNVVWQIAYGIRIHLQKELIEMEHYNTSYSELKYELNLHLEGSKVLGLEHGVYEQKVYNTSI